MNEKTSIFSRNNYMTTGEFARAMGVTKNTLFHYDSIGLFSPEIILDNDYRYYSIYQMELFDTILLLKELGMSLVQIRDFLAGRNPEKLSDVFEKREQQIELQLQRLRRQKRWIQDQKAKITRIQQTDFDEISVRHYPERYYVYMPVSEKTDAEFYRKTNQIVTAFLKNNPDTDYTIGYMQKENDIQREIYDNCDNILLLTARRPVGMKYEILEEGDYLTCYHKGHWDSVGEAYRKLLSHAAKNHLSLQNFYIEYYVIDSLMSEDFNGYVTEISVPLAVHQA